MVKGELNIFYYFHTDTEYFKGNYELNGFHWRRNWVSVAVRVPSNDFTWGHVFLSQRQKFWFLFFIGVGLWLYVYLRSAWKT